MSSQAPDYGAILARIADLAILDDEATPFVFDARGELVDDETRIARQLKEQFPGDELAVQQFREYRQHLLAVVRELP